METINNIATAATKAIWGNPEAQKEPISGANGDVSKGQPYDAGNLGLSEQEKVQDKLESSSHDSEPNADSNYTTSTTTAASSSTGPTIADSKPRAMDNLPSDSSTSPVNPSASISTPIDAKPAPADTSAAQNDTRAPEDANTDAKVEPKGPGPRPLNVVAKEHGGDAGKDHEVASKSSGASSSLTEEKDVVDDSESKGSGQMYVKTSGLAADGGDFDATKPGAGKEADRLMDEKGIHHEEGKDSGSKNHKDKPSLGERIKAKLHKH